MYKLLFENGGRKMKVKVVGVGRKWFGKDRLGSDGVLMSSWFLKSGKKEVRKGKRCSSAE